MPVHPPSSSSAPVSILALPAELTEHILILTARAAFPTAIAALARTCRAFSALVYHSPDHHLWREVFLATFDDPRRSPAWDINAERAVDWGAHFRARVWAANFLRRAAASPYDSRSSLESTDSEDEEQIDRYTRALEILIDVASTARPYPPTICAFSAPHPAIAAANTVPGSSPQPGFPSYPIFPPSPTPDPLFAALPFSSCCLGSDTSFSRNVEWLERVVASGLPPELTRRLSGRKWDGGILGEDLSETEGRLMQALGHVVAFAGFKPSRVLTSSLGASSRRGSDVCMSGSDDEGSGSESASNESSSTHAEPEPESEYEEEKEAQSSPTTTPARLATETFIAGASVIAGTCLDFSVTAQARRARRLARMRVYNLRFLNPSRAWGPFHLAASSANTDAPPTAPKGKAPSDVTGERLCGRAEYNVDSDDEDTDWAPLPEAHRSTQVQSSRLPPPAALTPDWAFLAAVRVVVEANLREAVGAGELTGLTALDGLRIGSAPIDLSGGGETSRVGSIPAPTGALAVFQGDFTRRSGKGRDDFGGPAPSTGAPATTDGSDWAGVTGIWRRCICWLDYRDLISHNLSSDFNDPQLTEAVRIVPMRLRVAAYGPPANPAFPTRPTLHIEGETAANGNTGNVRRLRGTVSTVKDGSIHWQIVLLGENEGDPTEWITEGVQVGGCTSAMGILGLWTGSQHERMDPLGPFWAWKVG